MANVYAVKSGNWSDTTVWNTGALPTSADDVYSNTFTVTINTSSTILSISNTSTIGVTAGGSFVAVNGVTLTLTGTGLVAGSATCLTSSLTTSQSFSVIGNVTGGSSGTSFGINNTGTGTVNVTGICTGGAGTNFCIGVNNASSGTVNITGNCIANGHAAVNNNSNGVLNITGNVTASNNFAGVANVASGVATIVGTLIPSNAYPAYTVTNTIPSSQSLLSGPFLTSPNGRSAFYAPSWQWTNSSSSTYYQIRTANLATIRSLYTADSVGGNPAVTNVRSGTVYGPASELTGTCAVPNANSVAYGVPVDNTTGNAVLTPASVKEACSKAVVPALLALG